MILYKVLDHDGTARIGNSFWHLPKGKQPGKWMAPIKEDLVPCKNGYHLCRDTDLMNWLGPAIFEVEYRGEMIEAKDKIVVREARLIRKCGGWNETTACLFAADCAEHVLPIFEKLHPDDKRPRKAIEAARAYARGEIDNATRSATRSAAWIAPLIAAESAAWSAARGATRNAAWSAENKWQRKRLTEYLTSNGQSAKAKAA